MTTESVRAYCLSLPHVTEDLKPQWGDALLLRIGGKIFVSLSLTQVPLRMNLKCTPGRFAELLEIEGVKVADYVGRYQWIDVPLAGAFRDAELKDLIRESYENVRGKLTKKLLAAMEEKGRAATRARRPTSAGKRT